MARNWKLAQATVEKTVGSLPVSLLDFSNVLELCMLSAHKMCYIRLRLVIVSGILHNLLALFQTSKYYRGGFEAKMSKREAGLILGVR